MIPTPSRRNLLAAGLGATLAALQVAGALRMPSHPLTPTVWGVVLVTTVGSLALLWSRSFDARLCLGIIAFLQGTVALLSLTLGLPGREARPQHLFEWSVLLLSALIVVALFRSDAAPGRAGRGRHDHYAR